MDLTDFKTPQKTDQNMYYIWLNKPKKYTLHKVKLVNNDNFTIGEHCKFEFDNTSKLVKIEELCKDCMINFKKDWFPSSNISDDYITNNFVKVSDTNKIKLREYITYYDMNKNKKTHSDFNFEECLDIVVVLQGIWVQKSKWGMILQVEQMRQDIYHEESYDFEDDNEDFF